MKIRYIAQSERTVCAEKLKTNTDKTKQYRHFALDECEIYTVVLLNRIYIIKSPKKNYIFSLELCSVPLIGFCAYWVRTETREIIRGCFFNYIFTHLTNNHWYPVKTLHKKYHAHQSHDLLKSMHVTVTGQLWRTSHSLNNFLWTAAVRKATEIWPKDGSLLMCHRRTDARGLHIRRSSFIY
jgi:hypothetical protein